MDIKAICSDIDGTLLNKDRELSQRTIAAVKALPKGFPVVLTSSRMPAAMRHLQTELGIDDHPLICYNGGYVIDGSGKVLDSVAVNYDLCQTIANTISGSEVHMSLYNGEQWHTPLDDHWKFREERNTKVTSTLQPLPQTLAEYASNDRGAHKVMLMGPAEEIQQAFDQLGGFLNEDIHLYRAKDTYIEIAPKAISKATALTTLLKDLFDIPPQQVMAFGDNYNDMDMIQTVGWGVAVGNAREELKKVANEVTAANTEDGVAISIEKWLL